MLQTWKNQGPRQLLNVKALSMWKYCWNIIISKKTKYNDYQETSKIIEQNYKIRQTWGEGHVKDNEV